MVHHLVHEVAVVADHDDAAREVLQVFFQNLQRHDVEVVGGLVEYQEVGVLHQYRTQVQFSTLATAELIYIIILLLWGKQEILQQLRGRHLTSTAQVHIVGDGSYHIDDLILLVKLQTFLREVAELHRLAYHDASFVNGLQSQQHFDKCRLSRTIVANDTHLLKAREVVVEVLEDNDLVIG